MSRRLKYTHARGVRPDYNGVSRALRRRDDDCHADDAMLRADLRPELDGFAAEEPVDPEDLWLGRQLLDAADELLSWPKVTAIRNFAAGQTLLESAQTVGSQPGFTPHVLSVERTRQILREGLWQLREKSGLVRPRDRRYSSSRDWVAA